MRLDIKATAVTASLLWGGAILTVGLMNMAKPRYGQRFLKGIASIYPGYQGEPDPKDLAIGTAYALLDGAAGGAIFAAVYNHFTSPGEFSNRLSKVA